MERNTPSTGSVFGAEHQGATWRTGSLSSSGSRDRRAADHQRVGVRLLRGPGREETLDFHGKSSLV